MNKSFKIALAASCLVMTACSTTSSLGHFTTASTHNVRNLNYEVANKTAVRTEGEACINTFFGMDFGAEENRQQIAMENAIRSGQDNGVDGDMLVNVLIKEKDTNLLGYRSNCIIVSGDLVKLTQ